MAGSYDLDPVYDASPIRSAPPSSTPLPVILLDASQSTAASPTCTNQTLPLITTPLEMGSNRVEAASSRYSDGVEMPVGYEGNKETLHQPVPLATRPPNEEQIQCSHTMDTIIRDVEQKIRINTSFSLNTLHKIFVSFGHEKRALLDKISLGGLLKVQNQRFHCRNLILSLLIHMDPTTGTMKLHSGQLTVKPKDVNLVLGIPYKGEDVKQCTPCPGIVKKVKALLLIESDTDLTPETVQAVLLREYGRKMNEQERNAFKVAAILFADSCFLAPRGGRRKINRDILNHVADPLKIANKNWAAYVLTVLQQSALKIQQNLRDGNKSVVLDGCLFFLLVFYLDNLNFGFMTPRHDTLPRVSKFSPSLVSELLSYDQRRTLANKEIQIGRNKLRARETVIYTRSNAATVDDSAAQNKKSCSQFQSPSSRNFQDSFRSSETKPHMPEDERDMDFV